MVSKFFLEQSFQHAEKAITQGVEPIHQSLAVTIACSWCLVDDSNIESFMGDMKVALSKLSNLEGFVIHM
jgi:transcription factor TGA